MCIILSVDIILATQKGITDRCCAGDAEIPGVANDDDNVLFFFHYLFVLVTASKQTATPIMQCGLRGKGGLLTTVRFHGDCCYQIQCLIVSLPK